MKIEVWSDLICPWCYIGKRRFESALAHYDRSTDVQVIWRSFELDPNAAAGFTETLVQVLSRKYGVSAQQAAGMNAHVSDIAALEGLTYNLEHAHPGNTFNAHRLAHYASSLGRGHEMVERLMHDYFTESLPIGEPEALILSAVKAGFLEDDVRVIINSNQFKAEVRSDENRANLLHIRGVPFFLINEKHTISGAQPVEVFIQALENATE